jgi:hypothetical protein
MSRAWRWSLLGLLIAIVIGGLMPNAFLSRAESRTVDTFTIAVPEFFTPETVTHPVVPVGCSDASCSRGAPAPAAPTMTVVAAASLVGIMALAALGRRSRRLRTDAAVLPRGNFLGLFRPPQFS